MFVCACYGMTPSLLGRRVTPLELPLSLTGGGESEFFSLPDSLSGKTRLPLSFSYSLLFCAEIKVCYSVYHSVYRLSP